MYFISSTIEGNVYKHSEQNEVNLFIDTEFHFWRVHTTQNRTTNHNHYTSQSWVHHISNNTNKWWWITVCLCCIYCIPIYKIYTWKRYFQVYLIFICAGINQNRKCRSWWISTRRCWRAGFIYLVTKQEKLNKGGISKRKKEKKKGEIKSIKRARASTCVWLGTWQKSRKGSPPPLFSI